MKKNLYFRTVYGRKNLLKELLVSFFLGIASYPRLLLEVFIRRNMGIRYFNLMSAFTVAIFVFFMPIIFGGVAQLFNSGYGRRYSYSIGDTIWDHITTYIFLAAFLVMAYLRKKEIALPWGVMDTTKFTLSTGYTLDFIDNIKFKGKPIEGRYKETIVEPGLFLIAGIVLLFCSQFLGFILVISSIAYSLSYYAAYSRSDDWAYDINDEQISSDKFYEAFVNEASTEETGGFNYRGPRPKSKEDREKAYKNATEFDAEPDLAD